MSDVRSAAPRGDLFSKRIREQRTERLGRPLDVLLAGWGRHDSLGLAHICARVSGVDEDLPPIRARIADPAMWSLGDLRSVPLPPRSFDVVHVAFLLERIRHAELVLDRMLAGLRPGGLLLVRMRDRESAYGVCERVLPGRLRRLLWTRFVPGDAVGPLPIVHEPLTSAAGLRAFCLIRGLRVIDDRTGTGGPALRGPLARVARGACLVVDRLSNARFPASHDEVMMVIKKPQNHFARLI